MLSLHPSRRQAVTQPSPVHAAGSHWEVDPCKLPVHLRRVSDVMMDNRSLGSNLDGSMYPSRRIDCSPFRATYFGNSGWTVRRMGAAKQEPLVAVDCSPHRSRLLRLPEVWVIIAWALRIRINDRGRGVFVWAHSGMCAAADPSLSGPSRSLEPVSMCDRGLRDATSFRKGYELLTSASP